MATVKFLYGQKFFVVHRLVMYVFRGAPPTPSHVVNHMDGNRSNNHIENLVYATQAENIRHSLQARQQPLIRNVKPVLAKMSDSRAWVMHASLKEAAAAAGISSTSVSRCCHGVVQSCRGHRFRFPDDVCLPGEVWAEAVHPRTGVIMPHYRVHSIGRMQLPSGDESMARGSTLDSFISPCH